MNDFLFFIYLLTLLLFARNNLTKFYWIICYIISYCMNEEVFAYFELLNSFVRKIAK